MTNADYGQELAAILSHFESARPFEAGKLLVVGCSTSEVLGTHIGKGSSPEVAQALYPVFADFADKHQLHLAFQCCEHLNRALVVERALAKSKNWTIVHAIPQAKAGGSMASEAFKQCHEPCLVEAIQADYGIDIGISMIGMHMKPVVVPLRLDHDRIGQANVNAAFSRPKLIGGSRAIYDMAQDEK